MSSKKWEGKSELEQKLFIISFRNLFFTLMRASMKSSRTKEVLRENMRMLQHMSMTLKMLIKIMHLTRFRQSSDKLPFFLLKSLNWLHLPSKQKQFSAYAFKAKKDAFKVILLWDPISRNSESRDCNCRNNIFKECQTNDAVEAVSKRICYNS